MDRYESSFAKTHEIQLLQLRQERKMESQRLDDLKKELRRRSPTGVNGQETRAALHKSPSSQRISPVMLRGRDFQ